MGDAQPLRPADPRQLGRYRLTGRLGSGGMGIVYSGQSKGPDGRERQVAVKVIHPHLADAPEFRTRFRSEAALAARVARFCTAAVLDVDVDAEQPYLVTEYVDGPTLQQVVEEQGPLTGSALDALAIGIATALMAIHEAGIVHRDLKPGNVILSRFGPRVIDFGIARAADVVTGLTSGVIGSPPYMAPEQFRGEPATGATDIHAWGAVVCYAGSGEPPFGVAPPEVMLYRALTTEPKTDGVEGPLRPLVEAALSKEVASRPTARELVETLAMGLPGPVPSTPAAAALAAGVRSSDPTTAGQTSTQAMASAEALADTDPEPAPETMRLASDGPLTALHLALPATTDDEPTQPSAAPEPATQPEPEPESHPTEPAAPERPPVRGGRRRRLLVPVAVLLTLGIAAAAFLRLDQDDRARTPLPRPAQAATLTVRQFDADDRAQGPAVAIPGARAGGTVVLYASAAEWNLDPSRNYYGDAMMASSRLLSRTLTAYREDGRGRATLVGDLATNTGETTDGGRTWDFTIRSGLTFENGHPVTAADIAYGIARSFEKKYAGGPTYLQQWLTGADALTFRAVYPGPSGGAALPPGVEVIGEHALRLRFRQPHPDLPNVLSLPNTAAVPRGFVPGKAKPVLATGPYRVTKSDDSTLTLERNHYWDPTTDPLRTAYPDKYVVRFNLSKTTVTDRLMADAAADRTSIQLGTIDPTLAKQIYAAGANERWIEGDGTHRDLCFNTQRVTDPTVRRALALALDRESALTALGGPYIGTYTTSLLSPRIPGYPEGQPQASRTGDPEAARKELAGKPVEIALAYRNDSLREGQRFAGAVKAAFTAAGATVDLRPLPPEDFDGAVATKNNPYDAYLCSWQPDYLDGDAMLGLRFQGRAIRGTRNTNTSYLNVPAINQRLDELAALRDRKAAASQYGALERLIQKDYTPVIPLFDQRRLSLRGSAVEGVSFSRVWGMPDLAHVWVRP